MYGPPAETDRHTYLPTIIDDLDAAKNVSVNRTGTTGMG